MDEDSFTFYEFPEPGTVTPVYPDICLVTDDITPDLLISAYLQGIFPWFNEDDFDPVYWFCPDPRFVIYPEFLHVSKSTKKILKKNPFTYTVDQCFEQVMEECALMDRKGQDGTWIGQKIKKNYTALHKKGICHSFEVWKDGQLAGGFYGELIGSVFFGESMFTKIDNAAKTAFVIFAENFFKNGGTIIDCQAETQNMARYGAQNIPRRQFLKHIKGHIADHFAYDFSKIYTI